MKRYRGRKIVHIDGMALPIGSILAMGGDEIVMPANAWMMIHNPHNEAAGDGDDLRSMAGLLDGMRDQLAEIYSSRSRKPLAEVKELMAAETWMTGDQAVEAGFADRTATSLSMAAVFDVSRFRNAPRPSKVPETFEAYVELAKGRGLSHSQAVRATVIDHPDLHRAYLTQFNSQVRAKQTAQREDAARALARRNTR